VRSLACGTRQIILIHASSHAILAHDDVIVHAMPTLTPRATKSILSAAIYVSQPNAVAALIKKAGKELK